MIMSHEITSDQIRMSQVASDTFPPSPKMAPCNWGGFPAYWDQQLGKFEPMLKDDGLKNCTL